MGQRKRSVVGLLLCCMVLHKKSLKVIAFCHGIMMPYIICGNFNILRRCEEKNTTFVHYHSTDLFNLVIHT